jgi:hypothetical protein
LLPLFGREDLPEGQSIARPTKPPLFATTPGAVATMEPKTDSIRDLVRRTLNELGLADAAPIGETLLTLGGYYVGREFRFAGVRAVWMATQEQIKLYSDDGAVLRVVDLDEPRQAKAA